MCGERYVLFQLILQIIYVCNSERIIKINHGIYVYNENNTILQ